MAKKRWFRFHIDQWRNGTFGLTPNEIAVYVEILCELYDHDGFARLNIDVMAKRIGMRPSSFQKAVHTLVTAGKLDIHNGMVTNRGVTEEIISREKLGEKSVKSRQKLAEKPSGINRKVGKIPPYTEDRIKNLTTSHRSSRAVPDFADDPIVPTDALLRSFARKH